MKKIMSCLLLVSILLAQLAMPAVAESREFVIVEPVMSETIEPFTPAMREQLHERGLMLRAAPSSQGTLPYTGYWNSVVEETSTAKYFTGLTKYKVTLDVTMNYADTSAYFTLYLVNVSTGAETQVIKSDSAVSSFTKTVNVTVNSSSNKYYFKFTKTGTRSCSGSISVAKP